MHTLRLASVVSALSAAAMLIGVGCGKGKSETGEPKVKGAKTAKDRVVVGFITRGNNEFWRLVRRGAEAAKETLTNTELEFRTMPDTDPNVQKKMMDAMVLGAMKVDALIIAPGVPAVMTEWLNAAAAKTIVLTVETDAPDSKRAIFLGTDHYKAGLAAGEAFLEVFPDGGKVCAFVGDAGAPDAAARLLGIKDASQNKVTVLGDVYIDSGNPETALQNVERARTKYGASLNGFIGLWVYNTPAIVKGIQAGGARAKNLKVVGFEEDEATLAAVEDGIVHATVVQDPYKMGFDAVKTAAALARGDESVLPPGYPQRKLIEIPVRVIKRDQITEFRKEHAERLGKRAG